MSALGTLISQQKIINLGHSKTDYNPLVAMLVRLGGGVNYCYNWLFDTSPLAGEVCFPIEMELKSRKQGEGGSRREKHPLLESVIHFVQTASIFPNRGRMIEDISSLYRGRIKVGAIPKGGNPC